MELARSRKLFAEARELLPGGVDSPVRAFKSVGGDPLFMERGAGSHVFDVDGNEYIDYVCSWGPLILGHAHLDVIAALKRVAEKGTSFGAPTEHEVVLARLIVEAYPSIGQVRFVNSGTEATMTALRLARGYSGRKKIVKFDGGYHGHVDSLLVKAGSGVMTFATPDSAGVPEGITADTISARFNDLEAVSRIFESQGKEIAALIVEPIGGNMGVVPPADGFLPGLREITERHGALLIFDEVITGFRVDYGGAQGLYELLPDLTCLGKIIGGGLPVGAYGGRQEIMEQMAPTGPVYQAGTLAGNPIAMTAGIETVRALAKPGVYGLLEERAAALAEGLERAAQAAGIPVQISRVGSMLTLFFTAQPVTDYDSAKTSDTARYARYFHGMLEQGVYFAPSQFECAFVSTAHSGADIDRTIQAAQRVFATLGNRA